MLAEYESVIERCGKHTDITPEILLDWDFVRLTLFPKAKRKGEMEDDTEIEVDE